ncbi:hypothetical protein O3M35_009044 [Rhynocoris fuscipes]|uniref:40S ribosomal protein S19 n=1 Tax=Rhynocoris fuscipes TaxID=488301 RepID=A0AAW1D4I8_9HEMI
MQSVTLKDVDQHKFVRAFATFLKKSVGVGAVTKIFGGRKRNGVCPSHYCRSSGSVARKALQSLEQLKLIEANPDGGRKLSVQYR